MSKEILQIPLEDLRFFKKILRMVRFVTKRTHGLDDEAIAQEIWLELWKEQETKALSWIHVRNRVTDAIRASKRRPQGESSADGAPARTEPPSVSADQRDLLNTVMACPSVDGEERRLIFLKFYKGMSGAEIAEETGITKGALNKKIGETIRKLKEYVGLLEGDLNGRSTMGTGDALSTGNARTRTLQEARPLELLKLQQGRKM